MLIISKVLTDFKKAVETSVCHVAVQIYISGGWSYICIRWLVIYLYQVAGQARTRCHDGVLLPFRARCNKVCYRFSSSSFTDYNFWERDFHRWHHHHCDFCVHNFVIMLIVHDTDIVTKFMMMTTTTTMMAITMLRLRSVPAARMSLTATGTSDPLLTPSPLANSSRGEHS